MTLRRYSLGGLVARYVLGLLDSRTPSFFDEVRPANFATFASPAIGVPRYKSFWSSTFAFLGSRLLSRTGQQLYERDRFLPAKFNPATRQQQDGDAKGCKGLSKFLSRRNDAEPLLKLMADPRYSFYRALSRFERIDVFANTCVGLPASRHAKLRLTCLAQRERPDRTLPDRRYRGPRPVCTGTSKGAEGCSGSRRRSRRRGGHQGWRTRDVRCLVLSNLILRWPVPPRADRL